MTGDLNPAARELAELMSEISEENYTAGWMSDLEYDLWSIVTHQGERRMSYSDVTQAQIARLKALSARCGGWIFFDDEDEETWVSHEQWKLMFEKHISR